MEVIAAAFGVVMVMLGLIVWLAGRSARKVAAQQKKNTEVLQRVAEITSEPLPDDPDDAVDLLRNR